MSKRQKRAWGAKQHVIAPKLHKRPHCRRAEHVWSEYIGMGREWEESLVLIGVSTLQLASQEAVVSVVVGVSISIQIAFY